MHVLGTSLEKVLGAPRRRSRDEAETVFRYHCGHAFRHPAPHGRSHRAADAAGHFSGTVIDMAVGAERWHDDPQDDHRRRRHL
eukprot:7160595-Pyramimonas_sp.AAC.1